MGVCPHLEFDNSMFIYCLGYDFYIYGAFEFYAIPLLIYDVMYDITTKPVITISKILDISCNGRRNVLCSNDIIDNFFDTINGYVCIRIVGGHSFL